MEKLKKKKKYHLSNGNTKKEKKERNRPCALVPLEVLVTQTLWDGSAVLGLSNFSADLSRHTSLWWLVFLEILTVEEKGNIFALSWTCLEGEANRWRGLHF